MFGIFLLVFYTIFAQGFGHDFGFGSTPAAKDILSKWHAQASMGFERSAMVVRVS
jgi:hypothetical protein